MRTAWRRIVIYDTLVEVNKGKKISRKLRFMSKHSYLSTKCYKTVCKLI